MDSEKNPFRDFSMYSIITTKFMRSTEIEEGGHKNLGDFFHHHL